MPLLVTVGFSAVAVLGDYLLKLASEQRNPLRSGWFYVGFAVYASTAFGWVYVMRHLKLATIGVVYSVSMILLLTAVGAVGFREMLNGYEVAGMMMAIGSLVLLMRFARGVKNQNDFGPPAAPEGRPAARIMKAARLSERPSTPGGRPPRSRWRRPALCRRSRRRRLWRSCRR